MRSAAMNNVQRPVVLVAVLLLFLTILGRATANGYNEKCLLKSDCMSKSVYAICAENRCDCLPEFTICNETCIARGKALGEKCSDASQCQQSQTTSECRKDAGEADLTCKCRLPRVQSGMTCAKGKCVIGQPCNISASADYAWSPDNTGHFCNASKLCACAPGYLSAGDNNGCVLDAKTEFQNCTLQVQCPSNATCGLFNGIQQCKCNNGYALASALACDFDMKLINDSCYYNEQCPSHYHWNGTFISVGNCNNTANCTCLSGYSWTAADMRCVMDNLKINDTCTNSFTCPSHYPDASSDPSSGGTCGAGSTCDCLVAYSPSSDLTKCVLDTRLIGQNCTITAQCPQHVGGSMDGQRDCTGGTDVCSCFSGYQANTDQSACTLISKQYGDQCYDDGQCPPHTGGGPYNGEGYCLGNCSCHLDYINATSGNCELLMAPHIDDPCHDADQCVVPQSPGLKGRCLGNACKCADGYKPDPPKTRCVVDVKSFDQDCFVDEQCQTKTKNSECGRNKPSSCNLCVCKAGYARVGLTCQAIKKELFQFCYDNANCATDAQECKDNICVCVRGYKADDSRTTCAIDTKLIDDTCSKDVQCPSAPNSKCERGTCACASGYKATADKTACVLDKKTDGSPCVEHFECPKLATCVSGKCTCAPLVFQSNTSSCEHARESSTCDMNVLCPKYATCSEGKCKCRSGFGRRTDGFCGRKIGTTCTKNVDCAHITYSQCLDNGKSLLTCLCGNGSTPLDSPIALEESCSGAEHVLAMFMPLAVLLALLTLLF